MSSVEEAVTKAIALVEDPEIPVTLVDLGVVRRVTVSDSRVDVVLRPTRTACPARGEMARRVVESVRSVAPGHEVGVSWELASWSGGEVTARGGSVLLGLGYANPSAEANACPYCGSTDIRSEGPFGGAVCKVPFSCRGCGSAFDALRGSVFRARGA